MRFYLRRYIAVVLLAIISACVSIDGPAVRAKEFLTSIHTGKNMDPEEWLTREARAAPMFNAFGGLSLMVKQTSAWATKYGGLKSVDIVGIRREADKAVITANIILKQEYKNPNSPVASEREDKVWEVHLLVEDGKWKIAP